MWFRDKKNWLIDWWPLKKDKIKFRALVSIRSSEYVGRDSGGLYTHWAIGV